MTGSLFVKRWLIALINLQRVSPLTVSFAIRSYDMAVMSSTSLQIAAVMMPSELSSLVGVDISRSAAGYLDAASAAEFVSPGRYLT